MPKVSNRSIASKARRSKPLPSIYRVRNWAAYDQALKQRGSVTLWFSTEAVQAWSARGWANQQVENRLGCAILNRMTDLGRPDSYKEEKVN
jgi:hypothetical protein